MSKLKWFIIVLNLAFLLIYFNFSVLHKEKILKEGQLVLLELAPVDPRSLMQGDYMALNYAISNTNSQLKRGFCVVTLDSLGVGQRVRLQAKRQPANDGEFLIEFTNSSWSIHIGAESYFFEEGTGKFYDNAKYGGLRIDENGNSVLVGLYDKNRKLIDPSKIRKTSNK